MPRSTTFEPSGQNTLETPQGQLPGLRHERPRGFFCDESLDRLAIPLLIAFSIALYIATTGYDLVGDDAILIGANPFVRSFHFLREIFTQNFWSFRGVRGDSIYYRPLVMFTFLLQFMLFGSRPGPFHLLNVLLNTWVVVMVYQLGKRLWPKGQGALWAALLFAALPVHSEDVATVSGISDLECAALFLAAMLIYTFTGRDGGFSRLRAWASALVFLLAALCKEVALVVPVLMVVYEHCLRGDAGVRFGRRLSRYFPTFMLAAFYVVVHLAVIGGVSSVGPPMRMRLRATVIFSFTQLGGYLVKLIWPQHLSYFWKFYPPVTWRDPLVLLGVLFTAWSAGLVAACWRRYRPVVFAILWFFLALAPVLNIAGVGVPAYGERYLYIPSVGICWIAGVALAAMAEPSAARFSPAMAGASSSLSQAPTESSPGAAGGTDASLPRAVGLSAAKGLEVRRMAAVALGLALLSAAVVRVAVRLPAWRNNFTLGLATLREDPTAAVFHAYAGNEYRQEEKRNLARAEYVAAIALDPTAGEAFVNLAGVLLDDGNVGAAEDLLRRCSQLNSTFSKPLFALGKLALQRGSKDEARDFFARALALDSNDPEALYQLGLLDLQEDRLAEAEDLLSRNATVQPASASAHLSLGEVLSREKKFAAAEAEFRHAIELAPGHEAPYLALAGVYEDEGKQEEALKLYRRITAAAPDSGNGQFRLGVLALKMGKSEEAIPALRKAIAVHPKSALAHAQLGLAYLEARKPGEARREIEAAKVLDANNETVQLALRKLQSQ